MDFEKELVSIAEMVPPEQHLAPETLPLANEILTDMDNKYGIRSDQPLEFHNAAHALGVVRRGVRLTNILLPYIRPRYKNRIFDLVFVGGAAHDFDQESGCGHNESNSADYALKKVELADGELNKGEFKARLPRAIKATTVRIEPDGKVIQTELQTGSHDPIKFDMAFSDINGIAMEGAKRMWQDGTNLYYEITDEPNIDGLYDFLLGQARFLRQRLNDHRIKSDIAYYFPDDQEAVYKDMRKAFHSNIISAYKIAVMLGKHPELKSSVGAVVRSIDSLDRSVLGAAIGKTLRRKLAA